VLPQERVGGAVLACGKEQLKQAAFVLSHRISTASRSGSAAHAATLKLPNAFNASGDAGVFTPAYAAPATRLRQPQAPPRVAGSGFAGDDGARCDDHLGCDGHYPRGASLCPDRLEHRHRRFDAPMR
jgi:hypothetical protein